VYEAERVVGQGAFGAVYLARIANTEQRVAIKKVHQDPKFINRELQIMRSCSKHPHPCVLGLKQYYISNGEAEGSKYLNLVMEYIPDTLHGISRKYGSVVGFMPIIQVKLYIYQLARAMAHIHGLGVTHRDLKLQNVLVDEKTFTLKLCDFGSAKCLVVGEPNVAYICSRHYRAPELIFEATSYTTAIDVWSIGCVMAELLLGTPMFPGSSAVDQLVEVIQVLGSPTKKQMNAMNPNCEAKRFPQLESTPLSEVFVPTTPPEAIELLTALFQYAPNERPKAIEVNN
jgi:glycogen synthase kinase 3 beta